MDLEEIGSLLLMIAIAVISGLVKRKKKQKSTYRAAPFVSDEIEFEKESENDFENDFEMVSGERNSTMKNDNFVENSPKSESYFTYEDVREKETDYACQAESISRNKSKVILQDSENEEETNDIDFSDPQELRKAVIYKEILENPYN